MTTLPAPPKQKLTEQAASFYRENRVKASVFMTLGAIGVLSYFGENMGVNKETGPVFEQPLNSGAHPILGFAAGAIAAIVRATKRGKDISKTAYYATGASLTIAADIAAEAAQSYTKTSFDYDPIALNHVPETTKDLAAAFAGYFIFLGLESESFQKLIAQKRHTRD